MNTKHNIATRSRVANLFLGVIVVGLALLGAGLNVARADYITIQPGQACPAGDYCSLTFSDGSTYEIVGPCDSTSEATFSCLVVSNSGSDTGTGGSSGSLPVTSLAAPSLLLYGDASSKVASLRGVQATSEVSAFSRVSGGQNTAYMYLRMLKIANSDAGNTAADLQASCTYDPTSGTVKSCSDGTLDDTLAAYYAGLINEDRKAVAQEAMSLYNQFIYDPCTFKAPAGDPNAVIDENQAFCASWGGVGSLFQGLEISIPTAEQFTSWAEGIVHKQELGEWASALQDSNTSLTQDQALHEAAFEYEQAFSGASEGAAYLTAVHAVLGQSQSLDSSTATEAEGDVQEYWKEGLHDISADFNREVMLNKFFSTLFELLVEEPVLAEAEEEAVGTLVEAYETGIAPAIAAATGAAFVIWNTANNNSVLPALQDALADAENDYTLSHYAGDANGRALILDSVVKSTLPLDYSQVIAAAVAPSGGPDLETDPVFQVTPDGQASSKVASFQSKDWTDNVLGVSQIISVRDGWFVSHASNDSTWRYQSHIDLIRNNERWRVWLAGKKFLAERFGVDAGDAQVYDGVNGCSSSSPLMTSGNMDIGYTCVIAMSGSFSKAVNIGDQVEIDGEVRKVAGVDKDANGNATSFVTTKPFEAKGDCADCAIAGPVWILAHPDDNCLQSNSLGSRAAGSDCIWNSSISAQDPNNPTQSLTVKLVYRPVLTVTASNATVDLGDPSPEIAPSYSGFVDGDTAASLTTPPTCTTNYQQWDLPGTYTTECSGAVDSKYAIKYVNGTLTVNAKNITVTVTAPDLTTTYGEFPVDWSPTIEPNVPVVGTFCSIPNYTLGDSVGTYETKCAVLSPQDYQYITFNYVPGTLTVEPAPLTITASDGSMTYGGAPPTIVPHYSGFVNGDSGSSLTTQPTCSTAATSSSPVGTYGSSCTGAVDANYVMTYKPGSVKVNPAPLAITASSATMIIGGTLPAITPLYDGFVNGDSAANLTAEPTCSTTATSTSPVGSYSSSCSGAVDSNYAFTYKDGSVSVAYGQVVVDAHEMPRHSGSDTPIRIELVDANGRDLSSAAITLALIPSPVTPDPAPGVQPTGTFRFINRLYLFNVQTRRYPSGSYTLSFTATGDPTTHSVSFAIK